jgi:hypothetical protein
MCLDWYKLCICRVINNNTPKFLLFILSEKSEIKIRKISITRLFMARNCYIRKD